MPIRSALMFTFDNLAVEKIRQIEIVRGPGSALYGANAFVAVINVVTKDADEANALEASIAAGNLDTKKISVLGSKAFDDNLKIFGSIDYSDTSGTDATIEADFVSAMLFRKFRQHPARQRSDWRRKRLF